MGENVHIELLGVKFSIQTDQKPEYVQSLVDYLYRKVAEIETTTGSRDYLRTAILTALLLADELFQIREKSGGGDGATEASAEAIARRLIEQIDHELE